ncbi:HAD hydrolase-like protein [Actinokineospora sp.]|uniref:HAD hydrolase-like protein n=1 Tax=Actinokineospora sp. TaxID=1872133 RepID=UPI003D6BB62D
MTAERVRAVLFDRDGTLVRDAPYNGDPDRVELMPTALEAVDEVRLHGLPAPGMVLAACRELGVTPAETVGIGDIGPDLASAAAAGARVVLVPTPLTRPEEVAAAPAVAPDLLTAVRRVPAMAGAVRQGG